MLSFSPRSITKGLLGSLPERSRDVLVARYGLNGEKQTLESIGQMYSVTRERVRQIENHGLNMLRNSDMYHRHADAIQGLESAIQTLGSVLGEETILNEIPKGKTDQNHVLFLLTVGHPFNHERENASFVRRWHVDPALREHVEGALSELANALSPEDLVMEDDFLSLFTKHLQQVGVRRTQPDIQVRWLSMSKQLGRNPLGEWGRADSPHVRVKSMRDYAYLALKRHGSPMHFTEVAESIRSIFGRTAHPATCHNELIKDDRFVLVGRGLYALVEWGYAPGVVRDVIKDILQREGPLTRDEIIERVKRERYVKDATINVNLQDPAFRRVSDGRYSLA